MAGVISGGAMGRILEASLRALALLAVIAIGAPSPAAAQATDPRGIGVVIIDFKPVNIHPQGIGVVIIDFKQTNFIMPLAKDRRAFDSVEQYHDWLRSTLNFRNRDGGSWDVAIVVEGQGFAYDSTLTNLVPVADPVATFIGGVTGEIEIGGNTICVNAERCANAVDPFTLVANADVHIDSATTFDQGARTASLAYARTQLGLGENGQREHARVVATTAQTSGGFEILSWSQNPEPVLVCDQLVSIEESNCYWMPKEGEAWIEVIGTNELGVGVNRTGKVEDVHGHCYAVQDASLYRSAKDVSAVTVRLEAYGWELDTSPNRFAARPNSLLSVHHGEDPWGVSEGMERYLDTDVTPDCN